MAAEGEVGYSQIESNRYKDYGKEIISHGNKTTLLTSQYEAFDPKFLEESGVKNVLCLATECELPSTMGTKTFKIKGTVNEIDHNIFDLRCIDAEEEYQDKMFDLVKDNLLIERIHFCLFDGPFTILPIKACVEYMDACWKSNNNLLIHCYEGRNRSAAVTIAWLMASEALRIMGPEMFKKIESRTYKFCFEYVKGIRSLVEPNIGFKKQLIDLEKQLVLLYRPLNAYKLPSLGLNEDEINDLVNLNLISLNEIYLYERK